MSRRLSRRQFLLAAMGTGAGLSAIHAKVGNARMAKNPFITLEKPRVVRRPDLPADLMEFYSKHEVDPKASLVYLNFTPLDKVKLLGLKEIGIDVDLLPDALRAEWAKFSGLLVAYDSFGDEIVYVTKAPSCAPGSIMVLGGDVSGPGGTGPLACDLTLVLAASFTKWLAHLKRWDWIDYGVIPGGIKDLPAADRDELHKYYLGLNPQITWAKA